MPPQIHHIHHILAAYPTLTIQTTRLLTHEGQFNDILIVNEALIFRFPRSPHAAQMLTQEAALLPHLHPHLTTPIPQPHYQALDPETGLLCFMGYPMLPGRSFSHEDLVAMGEASRQHLAAQLAAFLHQLHTLPVGDLGLPHTNADSPEHWADLYAQFRAQLFPYLRPDACTAVTAAFEAFLNTPHHFTYQPVLRHGDFGTGNLLYDPQTNTLTGVIDFGFAALGDPAYDIASISGCGPAFLEHFYPVYPAIPTMLERARFYRSTFALLQALHALRDNDPDAFQDGISQYV
jgi:aminoglycoside 2''-phosphotransferase